MGFWRSLRRWWNWDGSPDTDPFRDRASAPDPEEDGAVSGHTHAAPDAEPVDPNEEDS